MHNTQVIYLTQPRKAPSSRVASLHKLPSCMPQHSQSISSFVACPTLLSKNFHPSSFMSRDVCFQWVRKDYSLILSCSALLGAEWLPLHPAESQNSCWDPLPLRKVAGSTISFLKSLLAILSAETQAVLCWAAQFYLGWGVWFSFQHSCLVHLEQKHALFRWGERGRTRPLNLVCKSTNLPQLLLAG